MSKDPVIERNKEEFEKAESALDTEFANLPIIKHLRDLWKSKGLRDNDPAILLVELIGLAEARNRELTKKELDVIKKAVKLLESMYDGYSASLGAMSEMEKAAKTTTIHIKKNTEQNQLLLATIGAFLNKLKNMEVFVNKVTEAANTMDGKNKLNYIANILTPSIAFIVGAILMKIMS